MGDILVIEHGICCMKTDVVEDEDDDADADAPLAEDED